MYRKIDIYRNITYNCVDHVAKKICAVKNYADAVSNITGRERGKMALIRCAECGKLISSLAQACFNCGAPTRKAGETVQIQLPDTEAGYASPFPSRSASVMNARGQTLWAGKHGETAAFTLKRPEQVTVDLGGFADPVSGVVAPGGKYALTQESGAAGNAAYQITKINSDD